MNLSRTIPSIILCVVFATACSGADTAGTGTGDNIGGSGGGLLDGSSPGVGAANANGGGGNNGTGATAGGGVSGAGGGAAATTGAGGNTSGAGGAGGIAGGGTAGVGGASGPDGSLGGSAGTAGSGGSSGAAGSASGGLPNGTGGVSTGGTTGGGAAGSDGGVIGPDGSAAGSGGAATGGSGGGTGQTCALSTDCDDHNPCNGVETCENGSCVSGSPPACSDGDPCTADSCDPASGCVATPTTGSACDDGNPCTTGDLCDNGACTGSASTVCNDGNPCTDDRCDPAVGCVSAANAASCDDGNPCTSGDTCSAGACAGVGVSCDDGNPCTADSCDAGGSCVHSPLVDGVPCSDDGNPCTVDTCQAGACHTPVPAGTVQCRSASCSGSPPSATSVAFCDGTATCPPAVVTSCGSDPCNSAGTACQNGCAVDTDCPQSFYCNTGKCVPQVSNGTPCTRGAQCTGSNCVDGVCCDTPCGGGSTTDCQACNVTPGTCTPLSGTACSDGNACTTGDRCSAGSCTPGAAMSCDDGNPCTVDSCDAQNGCVHLPGPDGTTCNDGNACTTNDACFGGVCTGAARSCDDANGCTDDSCNPATGCVHANNTAPCSDGSKCTVGDVCSAGTCKSGAPLACSDGNSCTDDSCDAQTGCVFTNNTSPCTDGNACTTGDTCSNGACVGGPAPSCDDANVCTTDSCAPATGCVHTPNTLSCNDGNACTTNDTCSAGTCKGGPAKVCNDNNGCTTDTCAPATGCAFTNNTSPCNDGNACTTNDICSGGSCKGGAALSCNDGNGCTDDSCSPSTGCVFTNNTSPCNDGNACTTSDTCSGGSCKGGAAPNCNDGNPCTDDTCSSSTGCVHTPNTLPCDDGSACTTGDTCSNSACVGKAVNCDDGVFCDGVETCNPSTGCVAGTPVTCPNADGFACTVEFCNEGAKKCDFVLQDVLCDDKLFCDGVEQCKPSDPKHDSKGCIAGTPPPCDDGIPCTTDGCSNSIGACTFTPVDALCDNANVCDGVETCSAVSGCVAGTALACNDNKLCTVDSCNPSTGCVFTPDDAPCQDGLYCDGHEVCNPSSGSSNPATGCVAGTKISCPPTDAIACTQDVCDEAAKSCKVFFDNSQCPPGVACTTQGCGKPCTTNNDCNDGLACDGVETCDLSSGSPGICKTGTPVVCSDGKTCTIDSCQEPSGTCVFTANNAACADANLCNGTETCSPAALGSDATTGCKAGTPLNCDDGVYCTTDFCNASTGCVHFADLGFCDDGLACNGTELCKPNSTNPPPDAKGCIPGTPLVCPDDGIACTVESCSNAAGGCISVANSSLCPCTQTCDPTKGCGNFCVVSTCQGKVYQCGDCKDNDGDCLVDSLADPECLGPCSDNEAGFKGNIPGQDHGNCDADCYFDQDNGSGNDQCFWSEQCDPRSIASSTPAYTPSESNKCNYATLTSAQQTQCSAWFSSQTTTCWDTDPGAPAGSNYCGALVPNGCDCFGCCVIPGAPTPVFLGSADTSHTAGTCDLTTLTDPAKCHPCTQVPSCLNACEQCEICIGKPVLPAGCDCQLCPSGAALCGPPCGGACPSGQFCLSGCCAANPK